MAQFLIGQCDNQIKHNWLISTYKLNDMKKIAVSIISVALVFIFSGCKKSDEKLPTEPVQIDLTANQISLISSENTFAFDIFKKVIDKAGPENIIISPLSISTALSMTLNGANGATLNGMLETLRMNGVSPETINNSSRDLTKALLSVDKRVMISIANSVWSENNFVVKKPFSDVLTQYYSAESKSFDITDPKVPEMVNSWIDTKTNGLIDHMLDQVPSETRMLLINAIYFKGKWSSQFDKANTVQGSFYKSDGSTIQVPMMKQNAQYKIYDGDGFTLAELPYGQGNFVMDIILPDAKDGIKTVLPLISDTNLKVWVNQMSMKATDISMPRFKYMFKKELKDILKDMGMAIAFTENADFSNISDIGLLISFVLHQALIETNEEGTEAAAATIIGIGVTSAGPDFQLNIDHPFIYLIRETTTNSILFMGKVSDPNAE